jgi:hypothetical protein
VVAGLRRIYEESEPSDMVEYHVVRQGVDERALLDLFRAKFTDVELDTYFSTPAPMLQAMGAKYFPDNTFGILARGLKRSGTPRLVDRRHTDATPQVRAVVG